MAPESNPYSSPESDTRGAEPAWAPCPACRGANAAKVGWTIWGGVLGPRMLNHVRCQNCGTRYNGKTGRYNTTAITVYVVVSILIGAALALILIGVLLSGLF